MLSPIGFMFRRRRLLCFSAADDQTLLHFSSASHCMVAFSCMRFLCACRNDFKVRSTANLGLDEQDTVIASVTCDDSMSQQPTLPLSPGRVFIVHHTLPLS